MNKTVEDSQFDEGRQTGEGERVQRGQLVPSQVTVPKEAEKKQRNFPSVQMFPSAPLILLHLRRLDLQAERSPSVPCSAAPRSHSIPPSSSFPSRLYQTCAVSIPYCPKQALLRLS
jgi:hypothetical protein